MARTPGTKKQDTHARIVRTAATAIRQHGFDGISVADLMDAAGLTHGGFYAHFASRDAMLAEALDAAASDAHTRLATVAAAAPPADALAATVDHYLSDRHVAAPERGCALAALGSETARQSAPIRRIATRRVREFADLLEGQLPGPANPGRHAEALGAMCTLVGALLLARAVDDPRLSKDLRAAARRTVTRRSGT